MEDKNIDRLHDKVDSIHEKVSSIDVTIARLTTTVEVHEARSTQLEGRVNKIEKLVYMALGAASIITFIVEIYKAVK
jgi:hypothetical protein